MMIYPVQPSTGKNRFSFLRVSTMACLLWLSGLQISKAQDIHFSQYFNAPMFLNPANTGNFTGDWRVFGNYRSQWRSISVPYTTLSAGYDQHLYLMNQDLGIGGFVVSDQSSKIGFTIQQIYGSVSYKKTLNKQEILGGFQIGYVHKGINQADVLMPDQYNPATGTYDPSIVSSYNGDESLGYMDLNVGFLWRTRYRKFLPEAGFSLSHINSPNESFLDREAKMPLKPLIYGKVKYMLSKDLYLEPNIFLSNIKKSNSTILGVKGGKTLPRNASNIKEIMAGAFVRQGFGSNTDAVVLMGGLTFGRLDMAISYDMNVSGLRASNNLGAFEISFIYRSISTILNSYSIPCERL